MAAKKTPKYVKALINKHEAMMLHVADVLLVRRKQSHVAAEWVLAQPEAYWIGMAEGYNAMLEAVLQEAGCYHGFNYICFKLGVVWRVSADDVQSEKGEYQSWCRQYIVKE